MAPLIFLIVWLKPFNLPRCRQRPPLRQGSTTPSASMQKCRQRRSGAGQPENGQASTRDDWLICRILAWKLSPVDRVLLTELQKNARITNRALAQAAGIAESTCLERVHALHQHKVLAGFHAGVNLEPLNCHVQALIAVRLQPKTRTAVEGFRDSSAAPRPWPCSWSRAATTSWSRWPRPTPATWRRSCATTSPSTPTSPTCGPRSSTSTSNTSPSSPPPTSQPHSPPHLTPSTQPASPAAMVAGRAIHGRGTRLPAAAR
jgi:hypothetical protein